MEDSNPRFKMTPMPEPGGAAGEYEEAWAQWFLERSFFRDFVYRNPLRKARSGELADAVVLFDDVALMVQVAAQFSTKLPEEWARARLPEKFDQLQRTHERLYDGSIVQLHNELHGNIDYDHSRYVSRQGLIVLAQSGDPYDPLDVEPRLDSTEYPIHVMSLNDFAEVSRRFDTAADFITYLEHRYDIGSAVTKLVNNEEATIRVVSENIEELLRRNNTKTSDEVIAKSVAAFRSTASGELQADDDYRYSLLVDDMIARVHEPDPSLPWNTPRNSSRDLLRLAEFLGWLSRRRRIDIGKKAMDCAEHASDGEDHYFYRYMRPIEKTFVFLATSQSRADRVEFLRILCLGAQTLHPTREVFGVATEPIGGGRSYDFFMREGPPSEEERKVVGELGLWRRPAREV